MRKLKGFIALSVSFIMLNSFSISKPVDPSAAAAEKVEKVNALIKGASVDGKIDFKELKAIVSEMKGSSLSGAEKLVLKLNKKKVSKSLLSSFGSGGKSQLTATLLCLFLGGLGIHRFYLGYTWQGIVQLLTLGGLGIWALIDLIRIITGSLQPKNGEYETTLGGK